MREVDPIALGIASVACLVVLALVFVILARSAVPVGADQALVISGPGGARVALQPAFVLPLVARGELLDLGTKTIALSRRGREAFSCRDGVRAEVDCELFIGVGRDVESILKVAQTFGAAKTFDPDAVRAAFQTRLVEALASVIVQLHMEDLERLREDIRDRVLDVIGRDLGGFVVHDLVIGRIEQAPRDAHDPGNIRDARGLRKITEETVREAQRTAELERELRVRQAYLRADVEIQIAEILARRTEMLTSLERATGQRVDMDAVDREIDDRLRALAEVSRSGAGTGTEG